MTGNELLAWIDTIFPGIELSLVDDSAVATSTHQDLPVAVTVGFSTVDTGLRLEADPSTLVGCELAVKGGVDKQLLAQTAIEATRIINSFGIPAQPGVLLENLFSNVELPPGATVGHGFLREPDLFYKGTPVHPEEGKLTVLLELVALTDAEYRIASEQGVEILKQQLRRRSVDITDWFRG